jgi:hypothetical protein
VCRHPFFWDSHKRLEFLVSISDRLEQESVISNVVLFLESKAHLIIGQGGWDSRGKALAIDPCLLSDMNKYRKYDTHCVRDLLRVIRNKKHHFHELSSELRAKLKLDLPLGFLAYFENRFPRLRWRWPARSSPKRRTSLYAAPSLLCSEKKERRKLLWGQQQLPLLLHALSQCLTRSLPLLLPLPP